MATVRTLSVSLKARTAGFQAGMRRAQGSMAAFTKTVRLARNVLGGFVAFEVGRILARAFSSGSTAAASFERQMSKINVLLEENQKHLLPQMTRDIVNLSLEFGESTESLAAGMFKIISSQFEAADAIKILRESVILSKTGFASAEVSVEALTSILLSFGKGAEFAANASDKLFVAQQRGKTDLALTANNLGKVISTVALTGLTLSEFAGAFAVVTRQMIKTDKTMNALNALVFRFIKSEKEAKEEAKKFGLELNRTTLETIGLAGVFKKLEKASAGSLGIIFQERTAIQAALILQADYAELLEDTAAAQVSFGRTSKELPGVMDDLATALDKTGTAWTRIKQVIGDSALFRGIVFGISAASGVIARNIEGVFLHLELAIAKVLKRILGATKTVLQSGLFDFLAISTPGILVLKTSPDANLALLAEFIASSEERIAALNASTPNSVLDDKGQIKRGGGIPDVASLFQSSGLGGGAQQLATGVRSITTDILKKVEENTRATAEKLDELMGPSLDVLQEKNLLTVEVEVK